MKYWKIETKTLTVMFEDPKKAITTYFNLQPYLEKHEYMKLIEIVGRNQKVLNEINLKDENDLQIK